MQVTTKEFFGVVGSTMSDDDAERIGEFLDAKFGDEPVEAVEVVEAARPKDSPIHDDFEWNNRAAADEYRLIQARYILRSIDVVVTDRPTERTRAYHQVVVVQGKEKKRVYAPANVVWATPSMAWQVKDKALRDLRALAERYRQYEELSGLVGKIDQLILSELV